METEPSVEVEQVFEPDEKVLLELLSEIKGDWTGEGCKLWVKMKLEALLERGTYGEEGLGN